MRRIAFLVIVLPFMACHRQAQTRSQMWTHYQRVGQIQQAIIAGQLHVAQSHAHWVARNVPAENLPASAAPYIESMRAAARAVADAPDLGDAAIATARMGSVCGTCHTATGVGPRFTVSGSAPSPSDSIARQMTLHLWAVARMWDGLTGPSDASWTHGALGLNSTPHYQQHVARSGVSGAAADTLARRLHTLGQQAAMAGPADRVVIYGEFLGTCSSCHTQYQVRLPQYSTW